jgi:NAD-dependent deacetylase
MPLNRPYELSSLCVLTPSADLSTLSASMPRTHVVAEVKVAVREAASLISSSKYLTAFTGAGISVESGIPPFRGPGGLWGKYDPRTLEIDYFLSHPESAWPVIREIFYDNFGKARPNTAHLALARLETAGRLQVLITQNIDNLHHMAGSERLFW